MLYVEQLKRKTVLYALLTTGSITGAFGVIYTVIKDVFKLPAPPLSLLYHVGYLVIIIFLILLAIEYRSKRQSGPLGKSFEYDKEGVLWHGGEKAIAFRVITFLSLLEKIVPQDLMSSDANLFLNAGRSVGLDFGQQFGTQIYPAELQKGGVPFRDLSRSQRIKLWAEYDSSTGWGLVKAYEKPRAADIVVKHSTLFNGAGGEHFAHFLVGYCETVINEMTSDFGSPLKFVGPIEINKRSIEFTLGADD